jgi:hypothetical protein
MAEILAEALYDRGNDVRQWPEDERELYRKESCISFSDALGAVETLKFEKAAAALEAAGFGDLERVWDKCVETLLSYADYSSMAGAYFPDWETTVRMISATPDLNPYRRTP